MVKSIVYEIEVREFQLQSSYYVHFWSNTLGKGMNPHILLAPPLFFLEIGFGIK